MPAKKTKTTAKAPPQSTTEQVRLPDEYRPPDFGAMVQEAFARAYDERLSQISLIILQKFNKACREIDQQLDLPTLTVGEKQHLWAALLEGAIKAQCNVPIMKKLLPQCIVSQVREQTEVAFAKNILTVAQPGTPK